MGIPSGLRSLLIEAGKWLAMAALAVATFYYFDDVRSLMAATSARPRVITSEPRPESPVPAGFSESDADAPVIDESEDSRGDGPSEDSARGGDEGGERSRRQYDSPEQGAAVTGEGFERQVHLAADANGHFYTEASVDGRSIQVIVDTGATGVALTYEDAERIGIRLADSDYTHISQTANGTARIAPVQLDSVRIGDIEVKNVKAFVAEPGKLFATLLGMNFLSRLSRVDIRGRELVLVQ